MAHLRNVHAQDDLRIDAVDGDCTSTLVLAFSSIGHDDGRPPSPEFVASATHGGRAALFIMDAARRWGHAPGMVAALDREIRARAPSRVLAIGSSMGAYAALVAAHQLPVTHVLGFGPQARLDTITEPRWRQWSAGLAEAQYPSAPLPSTAKITLFHAMQDDGAQAMGFPVLPHVTHILFASLSHSALGPHLKSKGCLNGLLEAALGDDRRRLIRIAASAGGALRRGH